MISTIKSIDTKHKITIGWSNPEDAEFLSDRVDFVSFHFYRDLKELPKCYRKLKKKTNKTTVLGEYGLSSYKGLWNPKGYTKQEQAEFHKNAQNIFKREEIPFISWTLYDYTKIPKSVVGILPWRKNKQKKFGFIDSKGNPKPSFKYISNN